MAQKVKNLPAMQGPMFDPRVGMIPLEKGKATHSNTRAWEIPWTGEHGGYSPWGCKESGITEEVALCFLVQSSRQKAWSRYRETFRL